jgi:hypothetical protein
MQIPVSAMSIAAADAPDAKPIDLWDAWLFAEADASLALATWTRAAGGDKARAYATYAAALDREERAGQVLALCVGRQGPPTDSS